MGKKESKIDKAIREAFGWQITHDQFKENLQLVGLASGAASFFAANATGCPDRVFQKNRKHAEEQIKLLKEQSISPFPLPFRGYELSHVRQIVQTEFMRRQAEASFKDTLGPQYPWSNDDSYRRPIVAEAYEIFRNVTKIFFGQEGGFSYPDEAKDADSKKEETAHILSKTFGWPVSEEDLVKNLRLSFDVNDWAGKLAQSARNDDSESYKECLDNANKSLNSLLERGNPLPPLPKRGFTIEQAILVFTASDSFKIAHREIDSFLDGAPAADKDKGRKRDLQIFDKKFKKAQRKLLSQDDGGFHKKNPLEPLVDRQDFWDYPGLSEEGKKIAKLWARLIRHRQKTGQDIVKICSCQDKNDDS